jgi:hypothetical protein
MHRFGRPMGVRYRNDWEDRIRNYLIVEKELGRDPSAMFGHFREFIGAGVADRIIATVTQQVNDPFQFFDAIYCINLDSEKVRWKAVSERFEKLGIMSRVRRFPGIHTPGDPQLGCALSHRGVIAEAERHGLKNVLVFEDDVVFTVDAQTQLKTALQELQGRDWGLLYLGGCKWEHQFPMVEGCTHLEHAGPVTTCHAIAYHESMYRRLLQEIPSAMTSAQDWIRGHLGIDQFYASQIPDRKLLLSPVIATQENLLQYEPLEVRQRIAS